MLVQALSALTTLALGAAAATSSKPNIILIITDDQDVGTLDKREFLPRIHKHLVDEGVLYDNFFAPVSVCCPSRVSLLRTQYAHNHNITFVAQPWGGWEVFNKYGYVDHTLPDFLQHAGYDTYYTGKLMNDHTAANCEDLPVSGFNSSDILVDPYTYDYWNPGFSRDNGAVKVHTGEYSTDLIKDKALGYLEDALAFSEDRPFFLGIAPIASHSWMSSDAHKVPIDFNKLGMQMPAFHYRHANLFATEQLPRKASFNPDEPQGVSWVKDLPKLNETQVAYLDEFYRARLRSLQPVDELVEEVVQRLEEAGQLDNTYIFYTSDNGFALGTHRRQPGKTLGYEEDIHVPLIVRGPGVRKGLNDKLSSYGIVDLSRTILDLAGAATDYTNDGVKINLHQERDPAHQYARHSISEYWVLAIDEGVYGGTIHVNNTYRTVRVHDEIHGRPTTFSYSVWCTGERELYNLQRDPHQVNNLLAPLNEAGPFADFGSTTPEGKPIISHHLQKILHRLDALTLVLKTCSDDACRKPYQALFPTLVEDVYRFSQVLDSRFDDYFINLPKVRFAECALGYQSRLEKPEWRPEFAFGGEFGAVAGAPSFLVQA